MFYIKVYCDWVDYNGYLNDVMYNWIFSDIIDDWLGYLGLIINVI